ncbi:hypothetical protein SprV_0501748600 [Sparganum proliferum]
MWFLLTLGHRRHGVWRSPATTEVPGDANPPLHYLHGLEKTFDPVNREGMWKLLQKFGCPGQSKHMVHQLHRRMMGRFTDNDAVAEAFAVTNGVKLGCVFAPALVSLMFSAMLMDGCRDDHPGVRIAYRTDVHLLNSRCMQAPTRLSTTTVHDLLFVDDCALNTTAKENIQLNLGPFAADCAKFELTINTGETVVKRQPLPNTQHCTLRISFEGHQYKNTVHYITPSHLPPSAQAFATHTTPLIATQRQRPNDTSHEIEKCASRFFVHVAPLLHVLFQPETITLRQAPWIGRLPTDAPTQST